MQFSSMEYWSGLPFPSPEDLPDSGIEPRSPTLQADALPSEPPGKPYLPINGKSVCEKVMSQVTEIEMHFLINAARTSGLSLGKNIY